MKKPNKLILTFDDLPLQEAIRKLFEDPAFVRSETLLITDEGREWILQKVIERQSQCFGEILVANHSQ